MRASDRKPANDMPANYSQSVVLQIAVARLALRAFARVQRALSVYANLSVLRFRATRHVKTPAEHGRTAAARQLLPEKRCGLFSFFSEPVPDILARDDQT